MLPTLANPAGLWALLGVPTLLLIHCLQQRSRTVTTSTLFLLENLAPESRGGRTFDWLRSSRSLWLQLLAVLLATWVLAEPRWLRGESAQTVVVVLDGAARMQAFRPEAARAASEKLSSSASRATHTEWIVLSSDPRSPPLYRGPQRTLAENALAAWRPALTTHDYAPALRLAHELAGSNGLVWFVTDSRLKTPKTQPAVGVGRAIDNVGFASASTTRVEGALLWRALIKNHATTPQSRTWWIESGGTRSTPKTIELAPGTLVELGGRFADGIEQCVLALAPDGFTDDDQLPLVRPAPKPLPVSVEVDGETGDFFRKLLGDIEGVNLTSTATAKLRVVREGAERVAPGTAALVLPAPVKRAQNLLRAPVVAERHPLVADLNWQGWLGAGPGALASAPGDATLLWQADTPLVWLRASREEARQLVLNFDWETSNAARLPATVLLVRRFAEAVREAQPGVYAANFDTGAAVPLAAADQVNTSGDLALELQPVAADAPAGKQLLAASGLSVLRAPGVASFFTVSRGGETLVRGAAQFADARQGEFADAETFDTGLPPEAAAAFERNTRPDPFTNVWLAAVAGLLLASWWPGRSHL